ncbi:TOPRIM nucleotidyl transferase/hydrolase domain-containing protein [Leifsonia poae]|uniref:TOPRIM nucleotidyl transferase/hydrolase domain-containing protein n=1 Tax=Leifsonia poae TaxID=110933 RepID=UPI003D696286
MSGRREHGTAILVEGASDRAAVLTAAGLLGIDLAGGDVAVVPMGGAMSIRRFVAELGPSGDGLRLRGLCDAREAGYYQRAGLPDAAIFVCRPDLEAELLRALGPERTFAVLEQEGDLRLFRMFQQQPAQRTRTLDQQLHRFLGTTSGRKEHYGAVLTAALTPAELPAPLCGILHQLP